MYSDTAPVVRTYSGLILIYFWSWLKRLRSVTRRAPSAHSRNVEQALGSALTKRESITHKAPLSLSVVIVLRNDRLLFQASIKAMLLFHMSAGRANPALLAPPAAFYEKRTSSQQASSLSSINEGEEEKGGVEGRREEAKQCLKEPFRFPLKRILIHWVKTKPLLAWFHFSKAKHRFHATS